MYLYTCQACLEGDHENCELGHPAPKGSFGGSRCICQCRGRSKEQMGRDRQEHMTKVLEFARERNER